MSKQYGLVAWSGSINVPFGVLEDRPDRIVAEIQRRLAKHPEENPFLKPNLPQSPTRGAPRIGDGMRGSLAAKPDAVKPLPDPRMTEVAPPPFPDEVNLSASPQQQPVRAIVGKPSPEVKMTIKPSASAGVNRQLADVNARAQASGTPITNSSLAEQWWSFATIGQDGLMN